MIYYDHGLDEVADLDLPETAKELKATDAPASALRLNSKNSILKVWQANSLKGFATENKNYCDAQTRQRLKRIKRVGGIGDAITAHEFIEAKRESSDRKPPYKFALNDCLPLNRVK